MRNNCVGRGCPVGSILAPVSYGRVPLTFEVPHDAVLIVMACAQKLKVYQTPAGFNDAYVAEPNQKATLEAWGSERDLFAPRPRCPRVTSGRVAKAR